MNRTASFRALACIGLAACATPQPTPSARSAQPSSAPSASGPSTSASAAREPSVAGAERVRFASRDADLTRGEPTELVGWLFRPQGTGPFAAVVALHGCGGLYGRGGDLNGRHRDWAERLARAGYIVLLPDSFTPRGLDQICTRRDRPIHPGRERVADAYGALAYLGALPVVRPDRIALLGWSNGGSTVLGAVGPSAAPRATGLAHPFRTAVAFYPGCSAYLRDDRWRASVPLQIFIGSSDDWTPAEPCVALAERGRSAGDPVDIVVYEGAYHDFDAPNLPLRVRHGVATTPTGTATVGTNEAARTAAIRRVESLLGDALLR